MVEVRFEYTSKYQAAPRYSADPDQPTWTTDTPHGSTLRCRLIIIVVLNRDDWEKEGSDEGRNEGRDD